VHANSLRTATFLRFVELDRGMSMAATLGIAPY
jgi:hypothetical protein